MEVALDRKVRNGFLNLDGLRRKILEIPSEAIFVEARNSPTLTRVEVPEGPWYVDLTGNTALTEVQLSSTVEYLDLTGCSALTHLNLNPQSVKVLIIKGCHSLKLGTLPAGIELHRH